MTVSRFVIVTGLSGAGKTQAIRSLEDIGFFCVDNLPPKLIGKFAELCSQSREEINKIALVVDIRGGEFFEDLSGILGELAAANIKYEILFLEASDGTLIRRFKEVRRSHPLSPDGEVLQWIKEERSRLSYLRGRANKIIDTSEMSPSQLREEIISTFGEGSDKPKLHVTLISFGYKYGNPMDSDLVFDVRFLPNPHYVPEMKPLTGNEPLVRDYVLNSPVTSEFINKFFGFVDFLLPEYIKEGKTAIVMGVGCTGGRHRSVTVVNQLADYLREKNYRVKIRHRDINKNSGAES